MRLDASKMGHLAGLLGVVTGQVGLSREPEQMPLALIDFGETFATPAFRQYNDGDAEIIWITAPNWNLTVKYVSLYEIKDRDGEKDVLIAEGNIPSNFTDVLQTYRRDDRRNTTVLPISSNPLVFSNVWNSGGLYMEFELGNETHTGKSYSPQFSVNNNGGSGPNLVILQNAEKKHDEVVPRNDTTTVVPTGSSSPSTPSPTSDGPSPGVDLSTSVPAAEGSSGQSKAGLSTGAIAGIAVGIGGGLLAVAGLSVWFCLRRRQSGRPLVRAREVGYGSDSGAVAMMPEKEAADLTESLSHPVYDPPSAPVAHHGDPTAAAASYAPYSDHVVAPGTAVTTPTPTSLNEPSPVLHEQQQGPGGDAGAAHQHQQQPIASRYAHLIEEGMTVEEIRRLEEEERQLDAAIEQAGHRHSQARQ